MKTSTKSTDTNKNFDLFISKLSENEILNLQAMSHIRGGEADGEGDGGESIIIIPKYLIIILFNTKEHFQYGNALFFLIWFYFINLLEDIITKKF